VRTGLVHAGDSVDGLKVNLAEKTVGTLELRFTDSPSGAEFEVHAFNIQHW
jgi:hypothetical protein